MQQLVCQERTVLGIRTVTAEMDDCRQWPRLRGAEAQQIQRRSDRHARRLEWLSSRRCDAMRCVLPKMDVLDIHDRDPHGPRDVRGSASVFWAPDRRLLRQDHPRIRGDPRCRVSEDIGLLVHAEERPRSWWGEQLQRSSESGGVLTVQAMVGEVGSGAGSVVPASVLIGLEPRPRCTMLAPGR